MRGGGWHLRLRVLGSAVVTGLVLVLLEVGAGWLAAPVAPEPPVDGTSLVAHPTRLWALGPGRGFTGGVPMLADAEGLRVPAREGSGPLVLTLGDSSVFGHRLPDGETLHDHLQVGLEALGVQARVRPVATPGWSSAQVRVAMDEVGWRLEPSLVVVACLWSDLNHDAWHDRDLLAAANSPGARASRWIERSHLLLQLRRVVRGARGTPQTRQVGWPSPSSQGVRRVPLEDYVANLDTLLDQARSREVGAVILTLPHSGLSEGRYPPEWEPYLEAQRRVAAGHGVALVSGTELIGRRTDVFDDGLHPNKDGQRLLGRGLAQALVGLGWPAEPLLPAEAPPTPAPRDPHPTRAPVQLPTPSRWLVERP